MNASHQQKGTFVLATLGLLTLHGGMACTGQGADSVTWSTGLTTAGDAHRADFDGDAISDLNVFRPNSQGQWIYVESRTGSVDVLDWGRPTDWPLLGDFNNDQKNDLVLWRPAGVAPNTGVGQAKWIIAESGTSGFPQELDVTLGSRGDVPVPGDYNGDGFTDAAVWTRPGGNWMVTLTGGGAQPPFQWGAPGDEPVQADYDGDGKTDFAVWRPQNGYWIIWRSHTNDWVQYQWGATTDIPVPGIDYDNDGKADITVYRASTGQWLYLTSTTGYDSSRYGSDTFPPGGDSDTTGLATTDVPVAGRFHSVTDGARALWRPSTGIWTIKDSSGTTTPQWGLPTDYPVNGQRRFPFVSPPLARVENQVSYEATALAVPPSKASCGSNGAAFLSGTPKVFKNTLSCWKSGSSCNLVSFNLDTLDKAPFVPSGAQDGVLVNGVVTTGIDGTDDNNIIRTTGGSIILEHLSVRWEPTIVSKQHRQGIAIFFRSRDCGATWHIVSSLTKANYGNNWQNAQLDMGHLFNNPYSGRVYFTVQNDLTNFGTGPVQSILYYASSSSLDTKANGDDGGASWTRYTGQPQLAAFGGSYKMTPSPAGREYLFGCPNAVPTMYVFSEATNSITGTWTDSASTCSSLFIDGSNNVSLISSEEDGDYVRVVFPQVQTTQSGTAWQSLHLENIHVTGGDNDFTFSKISENVITAAAGAPSSIVLATLIEPDMIEVPRSLQSNAALLYWVESNGPLSGGVAPAGTTVTNNGMLIRDLNLWAPIIPVVQNDGNGNPLYWSGWSQGGDYRRAAFAYDGASNTLNFFPYWVGSDNATWNTNFIVAHP